MTWTSERPSVDGVYWVCLDDVVIELIHVRGVRWFGPIEPPPIR